MSPDHNALQASLKKMVATVIVTAIIGVSSQGLIAWRAIPTMQAATAAAADVAKHADRKADEAIKSTSRLEGAVKGLTHELEQFRADLRQYNAPGPHKGR